MSTGNDTRLLSREAAMALEPGTEHYAAYVGPPQQYDFMGASQFRLLTTLGLREHHSVLDFGCGSLRVGRLLIPYLLAGRYYGLEPNQWLIEDGLNRELGAAALKLKRPTFRNDADFSVDKFDVQFDYILAQSIFSHAGRDIISVALDSFKKNLADSGLVIATFIHPHQLQDTPEFQGNGWVYPGCVSYNEATVLELIQGAGLAGRAIPWFHPRQTWFVMAHSTDELPSPSDDIHLSGEVLRAPGLKRQ
jgi:SAM-dependent methyltransferase